MYPYQRILIARHERGLLFRDRSLEAELSPGVHRIADPAPARPRRANLCRPPARSS